MPPRTQHDPEPEQVATGTVSAARDEIADAQATRLGELRHAEMRRTEGARRSVLEQIDRRTAELESSARESARGYTRTHDDMLYVAALKHVDYSIVRATFDFLGRQRVTEDELDEALAHVGAREV